MQYTIGQHLNYRKAGFVLAALLQKYREVILYVFFGGLTTVVNWVSYWFLADILHAGYLWATVIAQGLSILFAYVTNRKWVFESQARGFKGILGEMLRFFGARALSFFLDVGCMYAGVDLLRLNDKLMKLLSNVIIVIVNYAFSKLFVFRRRQGAGKA